MKRWKKILAWVLGSLLLLAAAGYIFFETQKTHHTVSGTPAPIKPSGDQVLDSISKGIEFLKVHQEPDGEFSAGVLDPKPAFTALVVDALARSPDGYDEKTPFVARAVKAILSHQQEDGGIYTPALGVGNYCTSVSIMALRRMENPAYDGVIKRARGYILSVQQESGGTGYNPSSRADLSNTAMSLEALRAAGLPADDEAYRRAAAFVALCQNDSETNTEAWAGNDGGLIYRPGESKAGERRTRGGKVEYISYGLMSYAGLVSFLWAGVDREDARVQSAYRWVQKNWTLEENRNLKDSGLYYYYLTMAKALKACGQRELTTSDGEVHDWPVELSEKIISLQKADGSWNNSNTRWFESDSILVTAYMVRALSICREVINEPGKKAPGVKDVPEEGASGKPRSSARPFEMDTKRPARKLCLTWKMKEDPK